MYLVGVILNFVLSQTDASIELRKLAIPPSTLSKVNSAEQFSNVRFGGSSLLLR